MNQNLHGHIEKIRLFVAVARAGSFHEAAKRVRLAQPSLSHAIKVLERTLDTRLFTRSRKGVKLTPAGKSLLEFGERLAIATDVAERRIRSGTGNSQELLRVGTLANFVSSLWPRLLKDLRRKHPTLSVSLVTLKADEVDEALRTGRCDLVLSTRRSDLSDAVNVALYRDRFGFYALKRRKMATDLPLIYVPTADDGEGRTLEQHLWKKTMSSARNCAVDTFESARVLAEAGVGTAILPERTARATRLSKLAIKSFGTHTISYSYLVGTKAHPGLKILTDGLKKATARLR